MENETPAIEVKNTFTPEHVYDFKGKEVTLPIYTQEVARGKNQGTIFHEPDLDKITYADLPKIWDIEEFMEQVVRTEIHLIALASSKQALKNNSKFDKVKNTKGEDEDVIQPGSTNWDNYWKDYQVFFTKLTLASESTRALKLKQSDLVKQLSKLAQVVPFPRDQFEQVGLELAQIGNKIAAIDAEKEAA